MTIWHPPLQARFSQQSNMQHLSQEARIHLVITAITAIRENLHFSFRKAARCYQIPYSTLFDRTRRSTYQVALSRTVS